MPIATVQLPNGKVADIEVPQGATPQEIESFVMSQPEFSSQPETQEQPVATEQAPEPSFREKAQQAAIGFAKGIPQGLGNAAIGFTQAATDVGEKAAKLIERIYFGDTMDQQTFGTRLADVVKQRKAEQAQLPTAEKVGIFVGENAPLIASGAGTGAKVAAATGSRIAGLGAGGAVGGTTSGALSMQEEAGLGNRAREALKQGATGAVVGAGLGIAGKLAGAIGGGLKETAQAVKAGFKAKPIEELADIGSGIADQSSALYKAVDESGAVFKPQAMKQMLGEVNSAVSEGGTLFKTNHPKTIGLLQEINKDIQSKGGTVTLTQLDGYRKALSNAAQESVTSIGKTTDDGRRLKTAIRAIDKFIDQSPADKILSLPKEAGENVIQNYRQAQNTWRTYSKFETVANLVKKADGDPNRLKTLVKNFVDNEKKLSGFSSNEIEALRKASQNSTSEGLLKAIGKFGFDVGSGRNMGNTIVPGASILYGGGKGQLTAAVGTLARQAQKLSARGKVEDVLNVIRGQDPQIASKVVQKLPPKTRDYVLTNLLTQTASQ